MAIEWWPRFTQIPYVQSELSREWEKQEDLAKIIGQNILIDLCKEKDETIHMIIHLMISNNNITITDMKLKLKEKTFIIEQFINIFFKKYEFPCEFLERYAKKLITDKEDKYEEEKIKFIFYRYLLEKKESMDQNLLEWSKYFNRDKKCLISSKE